MTEAVKDPDIFAAKCPTRQVLDLISDKWTTLIISLLNRDGVQRFSQIQRSIEGISQKMLTQTLRSLERDGLISRKIYGEVPPRVEYELTELGETFTVPIAAVHQWAVEHIMEVMAHRASVTTLSSKEVAP